MDRFDMETDRRDTPDAHELTQEALRPFELADNGENQETQLESDDINSINDSGVKSQEQLDDMSLESDDVLESEIPPVEIGDNPPIVIGDNPPDFELQDNIDIHDDLEDSYYNSPEDIQGPPPFPPEGPDQQPGETTVDLGAYTLNSDEGPLYYSDKDGVDDTTIDLGIHTLDPDEVVYAGEGEVLPAGYISDSEREEGYFSMDDNDAELAASLGDSGNDGNDGDD